MLNLLVIYDAWAGPMGLSEEEKKRRAAAGAGTAAETPDASKAPASPNP
ncbi:MAG: hypothetical protein ACKOK8_17450 [Planctomycetia bacterium]